MDLEKRSRLLSLLRTMFLSFENVDWSRTKAYSKGNYGQIFVNLKGREPFGSVEPGQEFSGVRDCLIQRLGSIRDPETGEKIIGRVHTSEELYNGKHLCRAPDISFLPRDMSNKALGTMSFMSNRFIRPSYGLSGDHRMNGVLICAGNDIRRGKTLEGAHIVDLAPTVLHLMGTSVPKDMDGRVLVEMFEQRFMQANPIEYSDSGTEDEIPASPFSLEEEQDVKARLRALGYL